MYYSYCNFKFNNHYYLQYHLDSYHLSFFLLFIILIIIFRSPTFWCKEGTMLQSSQTDLYAWELSQFATYCAFFFNSARSNTSNTQNHSKERSCNLCESRSEAIRGVEAPSTAQSSKDNPLQLQKHDICHLRAENVSL